ncbi:MAG TPA: EboA domain-containing protein [Planctomycetota bacterium]|nr:EboA domain-containing protein [Planctomycetota bacterium]
MSGARELLGEMLATRLPKPASGWLAAAIAELSKGADAAQFAKLVSLSSRYVAKQPFAPTSAEIGRAFDACEGWNPERWSLLDAARVALVLGRPDLEEPTASEALEEAFRYGDVGELGAVYRSLQFLPRPEQFVWRAGEGCRSSMRSVFEAAACDNGFPVRNFADLAWRQLVIKALFVEAPLWRVYGLDTRLDPELARMALDLAEERRSAKRQVQPELWLCLATHGGERGMASIERELARGNTLGRRAAAIALARAGGLKRLAELLEQEHEPAVARTMRDALAGRIQQTAFRELDPNEQATKRQDDETTR